MSSTSSPIIVWFRQDLRLSDNPALHAAHRNGAPILPVYVHDTVHPGKWAHGGASKAWLHRSLAALNGSLDGKLVFFAGDPLAILPALAEETGAQGICWNRCYEPFARERDDRLEAVFTQMERKVRHYNGSLLWEPWEPLKSDGTPYRVFTPFYRKGCLGISPPRKPYNAPDGRLNLMDYQGGQGLDALQLLPQKPEPRWDEQVISHFTPGEAGAQDALQRFLGEALAHYPDGRDIPGKAYTSRLSPHLRFGEISPNQAWYAAQDCAAENGLEAQLDKFCAELGWREFSYGLLYYNPSLPEVPLQSRFASFPWAAPDAAVLKAWQTGQTGYPIVDAGMRELWQTGYMHNRVRMIVGSFLVKHLLIPWQAGEAWFWDCLFDADLANNSASWQWIAGCGADAAPYFRVFNPITQGEKFDADGAYVRKYVPELKHLPDKYLHRPWEAGSLLLAGAGVVLGRDYPEPIISHEFGRQRALAAFAELKD